jgi:hypothetical protein
LRPSSFVICNTPVEVRFTSAGCLNYSCRTPDKRYVRNGDLRAQWPEFICNEFNGQIMIGEEHYYLSGEGLLMPVRKDQAPPDLRYFKQPQK